MQGGYADFCIGLAQVSQIRQDTDMADRDRENKQERNPSIRVMIDVRSAKRMSVFLFSCCLLLQVVAFC